MLLRRLVSVVFVGLLLAAAGGCVLARQLQPVAADNKANIEDMLANNRAVRQRYRNSLEVLLDIETINRVRQLQRIVIARYGDDNADAIRAAIVNDAKSLVEQYAKPTEAQRLALAEEHPFAGDYAMGFLTLDQATRICKQAWDLSTAAKQSAIVKRGYVENLKKHFQPVTLLREWQSGRAALLNAYDEYAARVRRQEELALDHARSFELYANARLDFKSVITDTIGDADFQGSILDVIDDDEARRKVEGVFEIIEGMRDGAADHVE